MKYYSPTKINPSSSISTSILLKPQSSSTPHSTVIMDDIMNMDINYWTLTFYNHHIQQKYERFLLNKTSIYGLGCLLMILFILYSYLLIDTVIRQSTMFYSARILRLLSVFSGMIVLMFLLKIISLRNMYITPLLTGNVMLILHTMGCALDLYMRARGMRSCENDNSTDCNPEAETHRLPQDTLMVLIVSILVLQVIVRCHSWMVVLASWVVSEGIVIACMFKFDCIASAPAAFLGLVLLIVLYDHEKQAITSFSSRLRSEFNSATTLEQESERKALELQAIDLRQLIGNVAHDLKTPMQAFALELSNLKSNLINVLRGSQEMDDSIREVLRDIQVSSDTLEGTNEFMLMTVSRAIDFTKTSAGISLKPNCETVPVEQTVRWAINCVNRMQSTVPIVFHPIPSNMCSHIITDKLWLIENTLCLVSNAVKYSTEGRVDVTCSLGWGEKTLDVVSPEEADVTVCERSAMVRIEVQDSGIGVPIEQRARLFKPFKQAQRLTGGTGLGLYSLYKRVEAIGGACGLSSRSDHSSGSVFWFEFPYVSDAMTANADGETRRLAREDTAQRWVEDGDCMLEVESYSGSFKESSPPVPRKPVVLLVEDSILIQKTTTRALAKVGCEVEVVGNGQYGLEAMKKKRYDFVLMDLQMPVMDGIEAVRRLRMYERETNVSSEDAALVYGISANSDSETETSALMVGMDGFLAKPFSVDAFLKAFHMHRNMATV